MFGENQAPTCSRTEQEAFVWYSESETCDLTHPSGILNADLYAVSRRAFFQWDLRHIQQEQSLLNTSTCFINSMFAGRGWGPVDSTVCNDKHGHSVHLPN